MKNDKGLLAELQNVLQNRYYLSRLELGSYRTALFMAHRIRHALKENCYADKLDGTIEADETLVGGISSGKVPVMAIVQRGGSVRSKVMPTVNGANLKQTIRENMKAGAQLHTDAHMAHQQSPARVLAAAFGLMSENFLWSLHLHFGQAIPFFQRTPSRCLRALSSVAKGSKS